MERLWLTLAVIAFFALCLWGMRVGWRRKARSQSAYIPPFPAPPSEHAGPVLLTATGVYVSSTIAGQWQNRIVTRGAGLRAAATWRWYADGMEIERVGADALWIARESIVNARVDKAIAGKVMGTGSLLIITWKLGDMELDTGLRGDDLAVYPQWMEALTVSRGEQAREQAEEKTR